MITNLKKLFYIIVSVLLFEVKSFGAPDAGSLLKDQQNLQKLNETHLTDAQKDLLIFLRANESIAMNP